MKIRTDENGYVLEFADLGDIQGSEDYEGDVPEAFEDSCWQFRLQDGALIQISDAETETILRDRFKLPEEEILAFFNSGE